MSVINIPSDERDALKAIDVGALKARIEQCLRERRPTALLGLGLDRCGPYVSSRFRQYQLSLTDYAKAKALKKTQETQRRACRAGDDLRYAMEQMIERVAREEMQEKAFRVNDHIIPPYRLDEQLSVCVNYEWRSDIEDKWLHGKITFLHLVIPRLDYSAFEPQRKPSTAKQMRDRQGSLYTTWEHLMRLAMYSIQQYFLEGRDPSLIPDTFRVKVDDYDRYLNNFSTRFWHVDGDPPGGL